MIIQREMESLTQLGTSKVDYDRLLDSAHEHYDNWNEQVIERNAFNSGITMTADAKMNLGNGRFADITQNAFEQYCNMIGVPASYAAKCYENGMGELAVENFDRWSNNMPSEVKVRTYGEQDEVHAVVSPRFTGIPNARVFELVNQGVDLSKYQCNQAFLSPEKMHLRFVDFDHPLPVNDRMFAGFTVSNNEIGRGSLSVKFFLYRFACKNGIVRVEKGGTLFSQKHIGLTADDERGFVAAFNDVTTLRDTSTEQIRSAQGKHLSYKELQEILDRVRRDCHMGKEAKVGEVPADEWINQEFGNNMWGVINFITQKAQERTLDDRLDWEQYAGRLLQAA